MHADGPVLSYAGTHEAAVECGCLACTGLLLPAVE
jgi:hypothetical protein